MCTRSRGEILSILSIIFIYLDLLRYTTSTTGGSVKLFPSSVNFSTKRNFSGHLFICVFICKAVEIIPISSFTTKTSQELGMLSRSLSDCQSLTPNVMITVSQFVRNCKLFHYVTKLFSMSLSLSLYLSSFWSYHASSSF